MKRIVLLILLICILLLVGCTSTKPSPVLFEDSNTKTETIPSVSNAKKTNCVFANKNIEDLVLSVEQLPKEFQEKNSWGEYEYQTKPEIKYDLYTQVLFAPYDTNVSIASLRLFDEEEKPSFSYVQIDYTILEFDDVEIARDVFQYSRKEAMTNENIKQDSGSYGDEDYEYYNDFEGKPYVLRFRKDKFVFLIKTWALNKGNGESKNIVAKLADELQKNVCEN